MLGTYRVEQKLAEGGMGSVFLGIAPDGSKVVLKVPHAQDRDAAIALADEARTGARLRHPAIIETLDFFVDRGTSVLVVAHIDGPSLFDLRRAGPLPGSAVAEIGVQLAGALYAIHTACDAAGRPLKMLHRDISPNNVLVDRTGQVRLIDLGIARSVDRKQKATSAGMVKGTLRYLAPEILRGGDHDVGTDLWALGLTLWEAAMGRYAVAGDPMNTMRAAMGGDILALGDGERVDADVLETIQALVCPAEQRIQNAKAAGAVLTRLANRRPGGRDALAEAVAVVGAAVFEEERTDNIDITLTKDRGGFAAPGSRPEMPDVTALLPREEDVAGVFTTTTPRDQIAAHAPARPPTHASPKPMTSVPSASDADVFSVRSQSSLPSPVLATASTLLQLPASQLPSTAEVHAAPAPATLPQMPRFATDGNSGKGKSELSDAQTLLAIPASQIPSPSQGGPPLRSPAPVSAVSPVGPTMVQLPAVNLGPRPVNAAANAAANAASNTASNDIHGAPTMQLPVVNVGAATLQMPAVAPAALPSEQEARATEARPSSSAARASKTDEDNLETMATIQMPQWVEPVSDKPNPRPNEAKPSLFIPIVVVDDLEEDS
jgi:serine/threonine protein kinase